MNAKNLIEANKYNIIFQENYFKNKKNRKFYKQCLKYTIILFCFCAFIFFIYKLFIKKAPSIPSNSSIPSIPSIEPKEKIYFDQYEVEIFDKIKYKLKQDCIDMFKNQKEFLNGIVRKFKPKKIVEVGTRSGGSSIVMLNAIEDFKDSKLYSIDINPAETVGECARKYFPDLIKNWTLFQGKIACEYIEQIGNDIDMAFLDTSHREPGEILDFLMILPFLKENAIVAFHDIAVQITGSREKSAPYLIFNGIRGEKYLPSGDYILKQDIGAAKLDSNQKKYYQEYFRLLGGQWYYFPKEEHVEQMRKFFKKYYEKDCKECLIIFEEAISFNRDYVKKHTEHQRPGLISD